MVTQLRTYTTKPDCLDGWSRLFTEHIRDLRTSMGFTIEGAWTIPDRDQFIWIVSYPGTKEDFEAREADYYASPAHHPLDEEAKGYLVKGEAVFMTDLE